MAAPPRSRSSPLATRLSATKRSFYKLGLVWDRSQVEPLPPPAEPVPLDAPIGEPDGDTLAWTLRH